ncbi:hypothetical protein ACI2LC_17565 [Nonomuraea wenchangensis]|uniref:hypothetical protein n=1 Tax=Nonomuraea wenchangensis TaxID=568860 RepID=UPI00384F5353
MTITSRDLLAQASAEYAAVQKAEGAARQKLADAIVAAARDGVRQVEIVKMTGYTRERVRQICRAAGIVPE